MTAYAREASAWSGGVLRAYDGSAWTGAQDNGYYWNGTAWVRFQPDSSDSIGVPQNLTAVPGDIDAAISWTDDTGTYTYTPTHIQLRIPETTAVWTELEYGSLEWLVSFLTANTAYQVQARYIARADGSIVATGEIAEAFFTTTALDGPAIPAADPGGTGGDSIVYWGDIGSSCNWEYIVQTADTPAAGAVTWSDTATSGTFAGDLGSLSINFATEGLACGALARFKYRSNCGGVLGDYLFGDPFPIACDWDVSCSGVPSSTQLNTGLYIDANCLFAFPEACGTVIRDTIDPTIELGRLPGFGSIQTVVGPHTVFGLTTNGTLGVPTLAGQFGSMALLTDADDASWSIRVHLEEVPGGASGGSGVAPASFPLVRFGRNVAISAVFSTTTTYLIRCSWIDATGTFQSLTSSTAFPLDQMHDVVVTMDADGNKILYVNTDVEDTNTDTTAMGFSSFGIGQDVAVYTNEFGRFRAVAAWDRVLTPAEVTSLADNPEPNTMTFISEIATTFSTKPCYVSVIDGGDTLIFSQESGQGLARIDISDRESPVITHYYDQASSGNVIIYNIQHIDPAATSIWVSAYSNPPLVYKHNKISLADLSETSTSNDNNYTGWSGTDPSQHLIFHRPLGDSYFAATNTQNFVNGATEASAGAVTGGPLTGGIGNEEPGFVLVDGTPLLVGRLGTLTTGHIELIEYSTPTAPTVAHDLVTTAGTVVSTIFGAVALDATTVAIGYYQGGGHRLGVFDLNTNTEIQTLSGAAETYDEAPQLYEAGGTKYVFTNGENVGSDRRLCVRAFNGTDFDTTVVHLLPTADWQSAGEFVIVDNYLYFSSGSGLVTGRIDP